MARRIRNAALDSRAARSKLKRRPDNHPFYVQIEKGLHLGYRPPLNGTRRSGIWQLRSYIGDGKYEKEVIGRADDLNDANGQDILDYWQAVEKAREQLKQNPSLSSAALTVDQVMQDYLDYIDAEKKDKKNAHNRVQRFILVEQHYGHLAKTYQAEMIRKGAPSFGIAPETNVVPMHG